MLSPFAYRIKTIEKKHSTFSKMMERNRNEMMFCLLISSGPCIGAYCNSSCGHMNIKTSSLQRSNKQLNTRASGKLKFNGSTIKKNGDNESQTVCRSLRIVMHGAVNAPRWTVALFTDRQLHLLYILDASHQFRLKYDNTWQWTLRPKNGIWYNKTETPYVSGGIEGINALTVIGD